MREGFEFDGGISPELDQEVKDSADHRVHTTAGELAIGESTCTAFAKLDV
jgi:hypothetical protein